MKVKVGDLVCRREEPVFEVIGTNGGVAHTCNGFIRFEDIRGWWRLDSMGNYARQNHEKIANANKRG